VAVAVPEPEGTRWNLPLPWLLILPDRDWPEDNVTVKESPGVPRASVTRSLRRPFLSVHLVLLILSNPVQHPPRSKMYADPESVP